MRRHPLARISFYFCCWLVSDVAIAMTNFAYVGTYGPPNGAGRGIYVYKVNADANWTLIQTVDTPSPSFLCFNNNKDRLYAVNELTEEPNQPGLVTAFARDPSTGQLTYINDQSSDGNSPCHLCLDAEEKHLFVANYGNGTVSVFALNAADGSVGQQTDLLIHNGSGPNVDRQQGPHAHMVTLVPLPDATQDLQVIDLGIDKVIQYKFDAAGGKILADNQTASWDATPGAGPRHSAPTADGRFIYVINELDSTISLFPAGARLNQTALQTVSTLPSGWQGTSSTAEIMFGPIEGFLYGSNRGHDSIAIFAVDQSSGFLTSAGYQATGGKTPRHFQIDADRLFVANQDSDNVVGFQINSENGQLSATGLNVPVPAPVCIVFA